MTTVDSPSACDAVNVVVCLTNCPSTALCKQVARSWYSNAKMAGRKWPKNIRMYSKQRCSIHEKAIDWTRLGQQCLRQGRRLCGTEANAMQFPPSWLLRCTTPQHDTHRCIWAVVPVFHARGGGGRFQSRIHKVLPIHLHYTGVEDMCAAAICSC